MCKRSLKAGSRIGVFVIVMTKVIEVGALREGVEGQCIHGPIYCRKGH